MSTLFQNEDIKNLNEIFKFLRKEIIMYFSKNVLEKLILMKINKCLYEDEYYDNPDLKRKCGLFRKRFKNEDVDYYCNQKKMFFCNLLWLAMKKNILEYVKKPCYKKITNLMGLKYEFCNDICCEVEFKKPFHEILEKAMQLSYGIRFRSRNSNESLEDYCLCYKRHLSQTLGDLKLNTTVNFGWAKDKMDSIERAQHKMIVKENSGLDKHKHRHSTPIEPIKLKFPQKSETIKYPDNCFGLKDIFELREEQIIKYYSNKYCTFDLKKLVEKFDPINGFHNVKLYREQFYDENYKDYRKELKLFLANLLWKAKKNKMLKYMANFDKNNKNNGKRIVCLIKSTYSRELDDSAEEGEKRRHIIDLWNRCMKEKYDIRFRIQKPSETIEQFENCYINYLVRTYVDYKYNYPQILDNDVIQKIQQKIQKFEEYKKNKKRIPNVFL